MEFTRNILTIFDQEVLMNQGVIDVINAHFLDTPIMFGDIRCHVSWRKSEEANSLYVNVYRFRTRDQIAHISIHFSKYANSKNPSFSTSRSDYGIGDIDDEKKPIHRPSRNLIFSENEENLNQITISYEGNLFMMTQIRNQSGRLIRDRINLPHPYVHPVPQIHLDNIDNITGILSEGLTRISGHTIAVERLLENSEDQYYELINNTRTSVLNNKDRSTEELTELKNELSNNNRINASYCMEIINDILDLVKEEITNATNMQQEFKNLFTQQNQFRATEFPQRMTQEAENAIFTDMKEAEYKVNENVEEAREEIELYDNAQLPAAQNNNQYVNQNVNQYTGERPRKQPRLRGGGELENITKKNISTDNITKKNISTDNITKKNISTDNITIKNIPTENLLVNLSALHAYITIYNLYTNIFESFGNHIIDFKEFKNNKKNDLFANLFPKLLLLAKEKISSLSNKEKTQYEKVLTEEIKSKNKIDIYTINYVPYLTYIKADSQIKDKSQIKADLHTEANLHTSIHSYGGSNINYFDKYLKYKYKYLKIKNI